MYSKFITKAGAAVMAAAMALNGAVAGAANVIAADTVKYEFEDAEFTGTIEAVDEKGASGGKIAYMTEDGSITLDVEVASAGLYTITVYAGGVGGAKQQSISINGVSDTLAVPESKSFEPIAISAKLNEGKNTIVITKSWGWTKFDYLTVETASLPDVKATQTNPCDPDATAETVSLMNYFASVYGEHIISGQQEIYMYGHGGNFEQEFDYLKETTGKLPAIRGFDYLNEANILGYGTEDGTTDRIIDWVKNKNGIATASWHLTVPKNFANYNVGDSVSYDSATYQCTWDDAKTKNTATDFNTANVIVEGTKENEYYMAALKELSTYLLKLQDENVPLVFRPLHEAEGGGGETGSWFWWGASGSAVYKDIWKLTYKTLTEDYGIHNLIWEWNSYNFDTSADWYPGDEYVDIIGYDKYNCTEYLAENNWQPSYRHNDSAISSTFYGIMQKYNSAKLVAMAENDCFSTVENLTTEKAGWLYFCTWYDGGGQTDFLSDPLFNTKEDTIAMYQSDYCITLDELPEDLYSGDIIPHPVETTTTVSGDIQVTTTTTTTNDEYKFEIQKKSVTLPEGNRTGCYVNITIEGEAGASVGGGIGYGTTADDWKNIEWKGTVGKDGTLTKTVFVDEIPESFTNAEVQVWWSNVYDAATDSATDVPYTLVSAEVGKMGTGDVSELAGDANLDGKVTISDAVTILQYLANSEKYPLTGQALKNADVDGVEGVTGKDAVVIQVVDAGVITAEELPLNPADYIPEI
ncbi:MAG: glycoside hydrolase [Ruminococcus sp.]|nr:glycoside hydrolase [Ruminococcus sp.]